MHRLCVFWSVDQSVLENIILCAAQMATAAARGGGGLNTTAQSLGDADAAVVAGAVEDRYTSALGGHYTGAGVAGGFGGRGDSLLIMHDHNDENDTFHAGIGAPAGQLSFLPALLQEVSRRIDVAAYMQSLCADISIESLTEDSGMADLCARIVEPFCKRLEAAAAEGGVPSALRHTLRALNRCDRSLIKPRDMLVECLIPHIISALVKKNQQMEHARGASFEYDQMQSIVDRVKDLLYLCFDQELAQGFTVCLSDQAAISRSKWFIERYAAFRTCAAQ